MGVPEKIKNGTKFKVCDHDELLKKGWSRPTASSYEHEDYHGVITFRMIEDNSGKILTVKNHHRQNWYSVEENEYKWPVAVFLDKNSKMNARNARCLIGVHFTGMTPIDGWFICKHCGINLREIK